MEMRPVEPGKQSEPKSQELQENKTVQKTSSRDDTVTDDQVVKANKPSWYQVQINRLKILRSAPKSTAEYVEIRESSVGKFDNWVKSVFDYLRNLSLCVGLALLGPYIDANQIDLNIEGLATTVGQLLPWIAFLLSMANTLHLASKLIYTGHKGYRKIISGVFWGGFIIVSMVLFAGAAAQQKDLLTSPPSTKASSEVQIEKIIACEQTKP